MSERDDGNDFVAKNHALRRASDKIEARSLALAEAGKERERIVEWLRAEIETGRRKQVPETSLRAWSGVADAIERGEHTALAEKETG